MHIHTVAEKKSQIILHTHKDQKTLTHSTKKRHIHRYTKAQTETLKNIPRNTYTYKLICNKNVHIHTQTWLHTQE